MEGEELLAKFDELLANFDELKELIDNEKAKMKAEIDAYNVEKEKMKGVEVNDDDIIHLNVGGHKMSTKRSTLCQIKGSLLASMFSGRWEDSLEVERDKDGNIFFDFDPELFTIILSYLRAKKVESVENPASSPNVPRNQVGNFNNLIDYLGLSGELYPKDSFEQHSDQITIQEWGTAAVHSSSAGYQYVLGAGSYNKGVIYWKLKICVFTNNWLFVGVVKADTDINLYRWSDSYGWAVGSSGQVWANRGVDHEYALKNLTKQGDTVVLTLDFSSSKLTLLTAGKHFHQTLPSSTTWRLHINLFGANDKIRIV